MEFIFQKDNKELFYKHWNAFTAGLPRYSKYNIESWLMISRFKNLLSDDLSFVALENKEPVGAVFMPLELHDGFKTVTIDGDYVVAPIAKKNNEKEIYGKIDELALEHKIASIRFLCKPTIGEKYNVLQKYGFLDTSLLNYCIDITGDFLKGCRKGHRCDIKEIINSKEFETRCYDSSNPSCEAHEGYAVLHKKQAGRLTRPKETFDLQYERMRAGKSLLSELSYQGKNIAYAYFDYDNGEYSYYASSAGDPDYKHIQTSHAVMYEAAKHLLQKGIKFIVVEQPASPSAQYDNYPSQKQLDIARFKRGFPGEYIMDFRGIKYYNKELFLKDAQQFTQKYWGNK